MSMMKLSNIMFEVVRDLKLGVTQKLEVLIPLNLEIPFLETAGCLPVS